MPDDNPYHALVLLAQQISELQRELLETARDINEISRQHHEKLHRQSEEEKREIIELIKNTNKGIKKHISEKTQKTSQEATGEIKSHTEKCTLFSWSKNTICSFISGIIVTVIVALATYVILPLL